MNKTVIKLSCIGLFLIIVLIVRLKLVQNSIKAVELPVESPNVETNAPSLFVVTVPTVTPEPKITSSQALYVTAVDNLTPVPSFTPTPTPIDMVVLVDGINKNISDMYKDSKDINSDVVGWIYLPKTKINYPIVYRYQDNNYYLNHDITLRSSNHGTVFMDGFSSGFWGNMNLVHGHSMNDGTMFGQLLYYKEQGWADSHQYIYIYDGFTTRVYQLLSVILLETSGGTDKVPLSFGNLTGMISFVDEIKKMSVVTCKDVVNPGDILALNTCSYESNSMHLLVYFTRVEGDTLDG